MFLLAVILLSMCTGLRDETKVRNVVVGWGWEEGVNGVCEGKGRRGRGRKGVEDECRVYSESKLSLRVLSS